MRNNRKTATRIAEDTARQEDLYAFLAKRGPLWTRMEYAVRCVPGYPRGYTTTFHDSTARRMLTADIEAINTSEDYPMIIISGNQGIKLASRGEFSRFIAAEYKEVFTKLSRVRKIARKGGMDLQTDLEGEVREAFEGG